MRGDRTAKPLQNSNVTPPMSAATAKLSRHLQRVPVSIITGVVVVALAAVAVCIAVLASSRDSRIPRVVCIGARDIVKQAAQWSTQAQQDKNPLLALIHANYAVASMTTLRGVLPDKDIERIARVKPGELIALTRAQQAEHVRRLTNLCPGLSVEGTVGSVAGWR